MKRINAKLENEKSVVQAIKAWYDNHAYGPSYRDLAEMTNVSLGTVFSVCQDLRELGIIEFQDNVARTIKLKGKK